MELNPALFAMDCPTKPFLKWKYFWGRARWSVAVRKTNTGIFFYGLANSYGTLGYILRLKIQGIPTKPFVRLTHVRCQDANDFFDRLALACEEAHDFVDGVVFSPSEHYLVLGEFCDEAPYTSDYTYLNIFYQSIRARSEDYLTVRDYLWRWDTDWFWCSKNLYVQNAPMRRLLGPGRLNSITYQKVMRWNTRVGLTRAINRLTGIHRESVIQDVDIPIENAAAFLAFFQEKIGIRPVWICPTRHAPDRGEYPLFPMRANALYINFGFWDGVRTREKFPKGYFNRLIEKEVTRLGGLNPFIPIVSMSAKNLKPFTAVRSTTT